MSEIKVGGYYLLDIRGRRRSIQRPALQILAEFTDHWSVRSTDGTESYMGGRVLRSDSRRLRPWEPRLGEPCEGETGAGVTVRGRYQYEAGGYAWMMDHDGDLGIKSKTLRPVFPGLAEAPPPVFELGQWVELAVAVRRVGPDRYVGKVRAIHPRLMQVVRLDGVLESWVTTYCQPWSPVEGELCEGLSGSTSSRGRFEHHEDPDYGYLRIGAFRLIVRRDEVRPAMLGEPETPALPPPPAEVPPQVVEKVTEAPPAPSGEALYLPSAGEWVKIIALSPAPPSGTHRELAVGIVGRAEHSMVRGEWICLSVAGYLSDWCRVAPADALDVLAGRRREAAAYQALAERWKAELPPRRAPHDWEPPDDYEFFRRRE